MFLASGLAVLSLAGPDARADTDPGTSGSASVTLAWDPNPEPDVIGYRLYYGTDDGEPDQMVDVGLTTTWRPEGLRAGTAYHATVTAYNSAGLESLPSEEITFETAAVIRRPPLRITLTPSGDVSGGATPDEFVLKVSGPAGQQVTVEYSDNLMTWTPIGTLVIAADAISQHFAVVPIAAGGQRFFRLRVNG